MNRPSVYILPNQFTLHQLQKYKIITILVFLELNMLTHESSYSERKMWYFSNVYSCSNKTACVFGILIKGLSLLGEATSTINSNNCWWPCFEYHREQIDFLKESWQNKHMFLWCSKRHVCKQLPFLFRAATRGSSECVSAILNERDKRTFLLLSGYFKHNTKLSNLRRPAVIFYCVCLR